MVHDEQVRRLRQKLMEGKTLATAAAAAGMSERTARKWKTGAMPSASKKPRSYRTRPDPFAEVWDEFLVPRLRADDKGILRATTLFELLELEFPGRFSPGQVRTLQRRVRDWRAMNGPEREVYFQQVAVPGEEAGIDFTDCGELEVTVRGEPFAHLLFEFVLRFSSWTWVCLAFSESFEALVSGLQGALWDLGGRPAGLVHDSLSAATHQLTGGGRALTRRFQAVLDHYDLASRRINRSQSNENGAVESRHRWTKALVAEELVLRGSRDFKSPEAYEAFVREAVERRHNRKIAARLAEERPHLGGLPGTPVPCYSSYRAKVRKWSTIRVQSNTYSVPSRLIGHELEARVHANEVEVFYRGQRIQRMPRLRGEGQARIDYRHVIWSLVRKPGAFARYRFREELFPTLTFRRAYDALRSLRGERADVEYVRILHLAASTFETAVEAVLGGFLDAGLPFDYAAVKGRVTPSQTVIPKVEVAPPDLGRYDELLVGGQA